MHSLDETTMILNKFIILARLGHQNIIYYDADELMIWKCNIRSRINYWFAVKKKT